MSKRSVNSRAGGFSLDDTLRLGTPVEDDSDQTEALVENNQPTLCEIADITQNIQISKVIGKLKNMSYFMEKTIRTFWPTQYFGGGYF